MFKLHQELKLMSVFQLLIQWTSKIPFWITKVDGTSHKHIGEAKKSQQGTYDIIQQVRWLTDSIPVTALLFLSVLDITAGKAFLVLQNFIYLNPQIEKLSQKYQQASPQWIWYTRLLQITLVPAPPHLRVYYRSTPRRVYLEMLTTLLVLEFHR